MYYYTIFVSESKRNRKYINYVIIIVGSPHILKGGGLKS